MPRTTLALENAALRQQLAISQRTHKPTRLRAEDRVFWVALRRLWSGWTRPLVIVKPATVLGWHRKGFKALWRSKSRSGHIGRPRIPSEHIGFIQRISGDHPEWGEYKIAEELAAKFGVEHSISTIRRYMVGRRKTPRGHARKFNDARKLWSAQYFDLTPIHSACYSQNQPINWIRRLRCVGPRLVDPCNLPWLRSY
jgi:hypothetical protein